MRIPLAGIAFQAKRNVWHVAMTFRVIGPSFDHLVGIHSAK
jgi:hypothetical protein